MTLNLHYVPFAVAELLVTFTCAGLLQQTLFKIRRVVGLAYWFDNFCRYQYGIMWKRVPLVPSSRFLTNSSCLTGSMRRERMRVGNISCLPASASICICSIASKNDTQLSFHTSSPSAAANNYKYAPLKFM